MSNSSDSEQNSDSEEEIENAQAMDLNQQETSVIDQTFSIAEEESHLVSIYCVYCVFCHWL